MAEILVLGAGVVGLNSALRLALETKHKVTVWAADSTNITSAYAGAYWWPSPGVSNQTDLIKWSSESYQFMHALGIEAGIINRKIIALMGTPMEPPVWFGIVPGCRPVTASEANAQFPHGLVLESGPVIDPPMHLKWLRDQLVDLGVRIEQHKVTSLNETLKKYQILINCTGLGARELCQDNDLHPASGQLVRVAIKTIDRVMFLGNQPERTAYIIPHNSFTILGGTYFANDLDLSPDTDETMAILARCNNLCPDLRARKSDIISVSKALRPVRSAVRLEKEEMAGGLVIHNYGHGRSGWALAYGCAGTVVELIKEI
jgi:D-amino-acid oxidase